MIEVVLWDKSVRYLRQLLANSTARKRLELVSGKLAGELEQDARFNGKNRTSQKFHWLEFFYIKTDTVNISVFLLSLSFCQVWTWIIFCICFIMFAYSHSRAAGLSVSFHLYLHNTYYIEPSVFTPYTSLFLSSVQGE